MARPRLLDLYCSAGGASMGYHRAGFEVVGVDINPQPNYPFPFIQANALSVDLAGFDAYAASPPCQRYSIGTQRWAPETYPDDVGPIRARQARTGRPWIIENVPNAPLDKARAVILCGLSFGLPLIRHRVFESSHFLMGLPHISHLGRVSTGDYVTVAGHGGNGSNRYADWCQAMGIDWMTKRELAEAIPPAYTQFLGAQLLRYVEAPALAPTLFDLVSQPGI